MEEKPHYGLKVGDKITSDFHHGEGNVVHTIIRLLPGETGSRYRVWTSVENCPNCGKPFGRPLNGYDAAWAKKIK